MQEYMPKVGSRGLDMMTRTCTVQANFDYFDEKDLIKKFVLANRLQPLVMALFCNSPFREVRIILLRAIEFILGKTRQREMWY